MGYKLTLFPNADSLKSEVKCTACSGVLDTPVCLPCSGRHLVCQSCLCQRTTGRQRLFRCPACEDRIVLNGATEDCKDDGKGVPNWVRVELSSLHMTCPKRCGVSGLRLAELERHFASECGKAEVTCSNAGCPSVHRREQAVRHDAECALKRVECRVCKKQMLNKDLLSHQVKTRCHELEMKLARKQCMKQCNKDVLDHYRLLREHSLVTMQEFRRTELSHLERMGVQGFARRQQLPPMSAAVTGVGYDAMKRCDRCRRIFNSDTNHETACRWHGGPIIQTFGGLCLACGKPSHTPGCILSAHREFLPPLLPAKQQDQQRLRSHGNASNDNASPRAAAPVAPISVGN